MHIVHCGVFARVLVCIYMRADVWGRCVSVCVCMGW